MRRLSVFHFCRRAQPGNERRKLSDCSLKATFERLETRQLLAADLAITEFMASNSSTLRDADGDSSDWIEIHNRGSESVSLSGWSMTDDADRLTKWRFPAEAIEAGQFLVVFASGKGPAMPTGEVPDELHTNFALGASGEYVALVSPEGHVVSEYSAGGTNYPPQHTDISYGLTPAGPQYFSPATPGVANGEGYLGIVSEPLISRKRGFYDGPFSVEITSETPGAVIRYTLDGSVPTESTGIEYDGPILVNGTTTLRTSAFKADHLPSSLETHTYLFLENVLQQSETYGRDGNGLQPYAPWGHESLSQPPVNGDWEVDPDIVNHPNPDDRLVVDDLKSVLTLSLVLPWQDMFGDGGQGIYIQGESIERVASIELIDPARNGFQQHGAVQVQGGSSTGRWKDDKLSLRFKFKPQLSDGTPTGGNDRLEFPLYQDSPIVRFDNLILDGVLDHSWLHSDQHRKAQYIQDQYVADLHNSMGGASPHGFFAHLYINGLYWGMYYVHDRPDHAWAAEMFGGDKDEYHAVKHSPGDVIHNGNGKSSFRQFPGHGRLSPPGPERSQQSQALEQLHATARHR